MSNKATIIDVLLGLLAGANLIETDYPLSLASKGLILQLKTKGFDPTIDHVARLKSVFSGVMSISDADLQLALIADKLNEKQLTVDLTICQRSYRWNEAPLLPNCQCYTCLHYSRSYLYHLFEVQEMNANILAAIHNMKVYDDLIGLFAGVSSGEEMRNLVAWVMVENFN